MEWLPEWRIFKDNESNWGFFTKIPYKAKMDFIRLYQQYSYYWKIANVKTLAAQCFKNTMLEFIGLETNIQTKPVGIDTERIKEELRSDVKKEDAIVCISRFTPHKRITHIIKALNMINYKGTLKLVGYGEEQMNYIINAGNLHIEFLPSEKKIEALQSSKICIALWSGIVPGEAFYSGIPVITYESDYMRELYGNTLVYAKNNSPASLGAAIEAILSIPEEARDDMARYGVEKIENKKINVYTLEESARVLESLLKEAKVKYNENKD
jgi:glycosyltransferase involved in cell wall biosynthesis